MTRILQGLFCLSLCLLSLCCGTGERCTSNADCYNGFFCSLPGTSGSLCLPVGVNDSGNGTDSGVARERIPPPTGKCKITPFDKTKVVDNGGKTVDFDEADNAFFRKLYTIYFISKHCHNQLWGGGYQLHKVPTYLVNVGKSNTGTSAGKKGLLINHPNPPKGSILVSSKIVYGIPNVYRYDAAAKGVTAPGFDFGYKVGDTKMYAFEYGSGQQGNVLNDNLTYALFVHEAFHRVQDYEEKWKYPPGNQDTSNYPLTSEILGLLLLEDTALFDGVVGSSPPDDALKIYYAARTKRMQLDPNPNKLIKNLDNFQEWLEGTAMYSEMKYLALLKIAPSEKNPNSIPGRLKYFSTLGSQATRQDLIDSLAARYYGSGAGVGVILDRLGDTSWKNLIRQGNTFYDIAKRRYASLNDSQLKQILEQAKTKYNYTSKILPLATSYASRK